MYNVIKLSHTKDSQFIMRLYVYNSSNSDCHIVRASSLMKKDVRRAQNHNGNPIAIIIHD